MPISHDLATNDAIMPCTAACYCVDAYYIQALDQIRIDSIH